MPIWPFKRRRRSVTKDEANQPLTEKAQPPRAATYPPAASTPPIDMPEKSSKRNTLRKRQISQDEKTAEASWANVEKPRIASEKENMPPSRARRTSKEDITALPMSRKLESSPHLRAVDLQKPPIPYNFRNYSGSQTSLQREPSYPSPPRPGTLRSRRSGYDSVPSRKLSSRRRKDEQLREEEIRAMSAQTSIPKRPGEGPLRRDSKKRRGLGGKDSNISLPPAEDSMHSMSAILEQRGWEIGSIDVFNPRPAVRLSGTPQYVTPGSMPALPSSPLSPGPAKNDKEKMPMSRGCAKTREIIGNRADDLDASDIRMLMERDSKRREIRKKEQQEKLDKKLRSRGGRNRGDSDKRRRETEDVRRAEEARLQAEEESRAREIAAAPTAIHPALRSSPMTQEPSTVGLGIDDDQAQPGALASDQGPFRTPAESPKEQGTDPFADPIGEDETSPSHPQEESTTAPIPVSDDVKMEDSAVESEREVPISQTSTPPVSPIQPGRVTSNLSQVLNSRRVSDLPSPSPIMNQRRVSEPKSDRRAGAWATFFKRGGTKLNRLEDGKAPPSEHSFSNTSRESMRNQPLPAHLIDTQMHARRKSGTPVRTQSKFREDLPELPISPPDSRLASPDVTTAAAAAAAARRAGRSSAQPQDVAMTEADTPSATRNDTPITPSKHRITSMSSIDSEASWLASGSRKRQSAQSALSGRRPEFSGSYEELGMDRDAEYVNRPKSSARKISSPALTGPDPDEETDEDEEGNTQIEDPRDPMTMHESVRRKPTLVHRDPRVKSREGLLTEYSAGGGETPIPTSAGTGRGSLDFDSDEPEPELQRAASHSYGTGHARQISAGSARLLDVPPKTPTSPTSHPYTSMVEE